MIVNRFTWITWGVSVCVCVLLVVALLLVLAPSQDPSQEVGRVVGSDGDTELRVIVDERYDVACYFLAGSTDIDCVPINQLKDEVR